MKIPFLDKVLQKNRQIPDEKKFSTAAGVGAALLIILLFVLAATYLRSLAFGIILAYFLLPLEQLFEKKIFAGRFFDALDSLLHPFHPEKEGGKEAYLKAKDNRLTMRATIAAFLTFILAVLLVVFLLGSLVIPFAVQKGKAIKDSDFVQKIECYVQTGTDRQGEIKDYTGGRPHSFREVILYVKPQLTKILEQHQGEIASFVFAKGKGLFSMILSIFSSLSSFFVDFLLSLIFFIYILQKLASCKRSGLTSGEWFVNTIYSSPWMPQAGENVRREAAGIIDHVSGMFSSWVRGYLTIIIVEWILYITLFSLFRVPYAIGLGFLAGMTVLIPCVGIISSAVLTFSVIIAFCSTNLAFTLCGAAVTYLLIYGILDTLILYPLLVGGAVGLTMLETILVVLIGASFAGIPGMILAMPAAAILKYLVPKIYSMRFSSPPEKTQAPGA